MEEKKEHVGRPPMMKEAASELVGDGIYCIMTPPAGFCEYLVLGDEKALLIDTGMGVVSIREQVEKLTSLPVTVINTHGHPDHAGGNAEFAPALMNPADFDVFEQMATREFRSGDVAHMPNGENLLKTLQPTAEHPVAVEDGAKIDLGGRAVRVIYAPGHTHGSLCVYDEKTGTLFTGDNAQLPTTTIFEWNSSTVEEFTETLNKLIALGPKTLMGGHRPNISGSERLSLLLDCANDILSGAEGEERNMRGVTALFYEKNGVAIGYTKANIRR